MSESARNTSDLISSQQLSFIVKYLLPDVQGDIHRLCHPLDKDVNGTPGNIMQSGSVAEGLSLPNMQSRKLPAGAQNVPIAFNTDIDTMFCTEMPKGAKLETWKQNEELKPCFCRLMRSTGDISGKGLYYSAAKAKERMTETLLSDLPSELELVGTPEERAAALLESQEVPLFLDAILAIPTAWPEEVSEWRSRSRPGQWPTPDSIDEIVKSGIHLVPKAHASSPNKDLEWRFSSSLAEIKLGRSLTEEPRVCYLALKALHHMELKEPEGLTSYHLKTIMLWMCENTPPELWTPDHLGQAFLALLDKVIRCLKDGRISNYFVPECNLIDLVKKDDLNEWLKKLEAIRQNPVPHLLRFHDLYRPMSSLSPPLNEERAVRDYNRFRSGLHLISKRSSGDQNRETFIAALFQLGFCYGAEGKFLDMVQLASHFEALQHHLTMEGVAAHEHADQIRLLINFVEALVRYLTEDEAESYSQRLMIMIQSNLANLQYEASKISGSVSERARNLANAQRGFAKIITSVHHDASSALHFANFLYDQRRLNEAIAVLTTIKASMHHSPPWCNFVVFNKFTAHIPDEFLRKEFRAREEIEYWVPTFTLYLLISCHIDNGQTAKARDLLPELYAARELSKAEFSYADSCVLLGYCFLRLGDREEALAVLKEAMEDYSSDAATFWYEELTREDDAETSG